MSQGPTASGPPTTSQEPLPPIHAATSQPSSYPASTRDGFDGKASLPAARSSLSTPQSPIYTPGQRAVAAGTDPAASTRPFGVRNILNPSHNDPSDQSSRPQTAVKFESPASTVSSVPHYPLSSVPPSPSSASLAAFPPSPGDGAGRILPRVPRRILTPKSPGRRAATLGTLPGLGPPATISASEAPFAPARGRIYSPDPSGRGPGDVPPMPTPPTGRLPLPFPPAIAPTPPLHDRRASGGGSQAFHSQSASPSPSHSSYGQYTSPATHYGLHASQSAPPYGNPAPPMGPFSGPTNLTMVYGSQAESGTLGQGSSLQMTFDTESGPMHVPVTVDVQAASKMADEKRKRNAGASARFRQRRKEKEKEASHTIAKLEQDIRDLVEDRDFYRQERNFFREMLSRTQTPIPARPHSPMHRRPRPSTEISPGPSSSGWQQSEERSGQGRNTRRRTSSYQPSYDSSAPPTTLVPPMPTLYRPPPPLQPPFSESRSGPPTGPPPALVPPPPPPPPRSQTYDPFRRDPYDRSWNPAQ
jgi:hypothetical protein